MHHQADKRKEREIKKSGKNSWKIREETQTSYLFKTLGRKELEHDIKLNENASPIVHPQKNIFVIYSILTLTKFKNFIS